MQIKKTKIHGLKIVTNKIYKDSRGHFKEVFLSKNFTKNRFVFSCTSKSKKNVLRGLHMQLKNGQGKFISVVKGAILDVVVDARKKSKMSLSSLLFLLIMSVYFLIFHIIW